MRCPHGFATNGFKKIIEACIPRHDSRCLIQSTVNAHNQAVEENYIRRQRWVRNKQSAVPQWEHLSKTITAVILRNSNFIDSNNRYRAYVQLSSPAAPVVPIERHPWPTAGEPDKHCLDCTALCSRSGHPIGLAADSDIRPALTQALLV